MLANGAGKSRAGRAGEGRKPAEWRVLFLSTGEIGIADKVAEDGRKKVTAGQEVRVIDVPADAGAGFGLFEDLHSFETDLTTSERLFPMLPPGRLMISESGIRDRNDVQRLRAAGVRAFLVGKAFMRDDDPGQALKRLFF